MRVFVMVMLLTCGPALAGLALQPDTGSPLRLVILPPWSDGPALVTAAGGAVVGPETAPIAVLAQVDDLQAFDTAIRALGALWVMDGASIAAFCGYAT
ncbi:hypothetical protein [uncultured Tateyamaria sp.]|uniref:hypothetical protein n=1 Tax=uncultured Tateyamaria sp. TaxID=455651 RepID=UPI002617B38E|nr:hypothetical protein [uncultured Tateyamaria sp.]